MDRDGPVRPSRRVRGGVFAQQDGSELFGAGRWIVEQHEHGFAFGDAEREDAGVAAVGGFEAVGERGVVDESGELEDKVVADGVPAR